MQDRQPATGKEGRVQIIPENGSPAFYAKILMADGATVPGTPINKASLLKDSTALAYGLTTAAVPDNVLAAARTLIQTAQTTANGRARCAIGSYTGDGALQDGASVNTHLPTFDFAPKLIVIMDDAEGANAYPSVSIILTGCPRILTLTRGGTTATAVTPVQMVLAGVYTSDDGRTVTLRTVTYDSSTTNNRAVMNENNKSYHYVAIG